MKSVYPHLFEPSEHPAWNRRSIRATTRADLENRLHFTSARQFTPDPDSFRLKPYQDSLDWFTRIHDLGDVIWPNYEFVDARDAKSFIDEIKKRGLYLFDIWGYVPDAYSNFVSCGEIDFDPDLADYMEKTLGPRFLGFDNGEQDGRYIGSYAAMMCPAGTGREKQYQNFQHYFGFMHRHLRNHVSALCSLNYGHYFLKEQDVKLIGSECGQALPNVNVWYAYLRGAGKQYGSLWFGNASVWNRWGWKEYDPAVVHKQHGSAKGGPEHGTSLSLLRRILYTHFTYNCDILGFESGFMLPPEKAGDMPALTPIGQINKDGHAFVKEHGYPGAQHTPVAIFMPFHNGWLPPRHLYTRMVYRVWGNEPYTDGDFQTHALFSLIYPHYENSGFFHDETGFLTATPHGDIFDVLFSDVRPEILSTYKRIVLSGDADLTLEDIDLLRGAVEDGAILHLFSGQIAHLWANLAAWSPDLLTWLGLAELGETRIWPAGTMVHGPDTEVLCPLPFASHQARLLPGSHIVASVDGQPLAYTRSCGCGQVMIILVPYGLNAEPASPSYDPTNADDKTIQQPFDFLPFVKILLGTAFDEEKLIDLTNPELQYSVNLRSDRQLLLTVVNNTTSQQTCTIRPAEPIQMDLQEIQVPDVDRKQIGYYPPSMDQAIEISGISPIPEAPALAAVTSASALEGCGELTICPLDLRMFILQAQTPLYLEKPRIRQSDQTSNRYLQMDPGQTVQQQINRYPTIDSHFHGLKIDARYLLAHDTGFLASEGQFVRRRGFDVIIDCSGLLNNYPDWSLADIVLERHARTLHEFTECLDRAGAYGCSKVILMLQQPTRIRAIKNGYTPDQQQSSVLRALHFMTDSCRSRSMTLYLQNGTPIRYLPGIQQLAEFLHKHELRSLRLALNISHALMGGEDVAVITASLGDRIAGLLISAPDRDVFNQFIDRHRPVTGSAFANEIQHWTSEICQACPLDFVALDVVYQNWNAVWADLKTISPQAQPGGQ